MTDRELLESMSRQMSELVHHVAEVRRSNKRLERDMDVLKSDVATLKSDVATLRSDVEVLKSDVEVLKSDVAMLKSDVEVLKSDVAMLKSQVTATNEKLDERSEFLGSKIDHFVQFVAGEITNHRIVIEEERHLRRARDREVDERLTRIEQRLDRLEAAQTVPK